MAHSKHVDILTKQKLFNLIFTLSTLLITSISIHALAAINTFTPGKAIIFENGNQAVI